MKARHWAFLAFATATVSLNENLAMTDPRGYTLGCRIGTPIGVLLFQGLILMGVAVVLRRPRSFSWEKTLGLFSWLFLISGVLTGVTALLRWDTNRLAVCGHRSLVGVAQPSRIKSPLGLQVLLHQIDKPLPPHIGLSRQVEHFIGPALETHLGLKEVQLADRLIRPCRQGPAHQLIEELLRIHQPPPLSSSVTSAPIAPPAIEPSAVIAHAHQAGGRCSN